MEANEDELTEMEKEQLRELVGYGSPMQEEKLSPHAFLTRVAKSRDTTKTGFLSSDEIGSPTHPIRTYKKLSLIASDLMGCKALGEYLSNHSETITSTSLSKEGFLMRLAVTTTKQMADITPIKKENKGWFKKKDDGSQNQPGVV